MTDIRLTTTTTRNDGTITATVYENVDGDGTGANTDPDGYPYDNAASVSLAGGVDEVNTLSGFAGGDGNTYWLRFERTPPTDTATTDAPTVTDATIETRPRADETATDAG